MLDTALSRRDRIEAVTERRLETVQQTIVDFYGRQVQRTPPSLAGCSFNQRSRERPDAGTGVEDAYASLGRLEHAGQQSRDRSRREVLPKFRLVLAVQPLSVRDTALLSPSQRSGRKQIIDNCCHTPSPSKSSSTPVGSIGRPRVRFAEVFSQAERVRYAGTGRARALTPLPLVGRYAPTGRVCTASGTAAADSAAW